MEELRQRGLKRVRDRDQRPNARGVVAQLDALQEPDGNLGRFREALLCHSALLSLLPNVRPQPAQDLIELEFGHPLRGIAPHEVS